jgi:hypothetical protein
MQVVLAWCMIHLVQYYCAYRPQCRLKQLGSWAAVGCGDQCMLHGRQTHRMLLLLMPGTPKPGSGRFLVAACHAGTAGIAEARIQGGASPDA